MNLKRDIDNLDDGASMAKKIKLEHKLIWDKIYKNHPDIDTSEHEIHKILLIFSLLLETFLNKGEIDSMDAKDGVQDIIVAVGKTLLKLLKGNIESLKLPAVIKNVLKKLKSFLFLTEVNSDGSNKNGSKNGLRSETKTNEATTTTTASSMRTS